MPITPFFAAIFAIMYILLSCRVIKHRYVKRIDLGSAGDPKLEKAIRTQANFGEYVPLALLLMWFLEVIRHSSMLSLWLGSVLLLGRIAHVVGINDTKNKLIFRQLGIIATFAVILIAAGVLIWHYVPYSY